MVRTKITYSTLLTLMRIAFVPCIVYTLTVQQWAIACVLFVIAAFTDLLDGALARWRNEHTFLGACLDPIADKLLVTSVFATLAFVPTPLFAIPQWFFLIILMRELLVILGSALLWLVQGSLQIKPSFLGKLTMFVEALFIMWVFACYFCAWMPVKTYYGMLALMLGISLSSLAQYAYRAYHYYAHGKNS